MAANIFEVFKSIEMDAYPDVKPRGDKSALSIGGPPHENMVIEKLWIYFKYAREQQRQVIASQQYQ